MATGNLGLAQTSSSEIMQRPTMRRKSSAQNLLASFTTKPNLPAMPPPPTPVQTITVNPPSYPYGSSMITPSTATPPTGREWDSQSMQSDTLPAPTVAGQSPSLGQGTSVEYLRDLVQKRIITLTYLRNVHEGRSHWFHTIAMTRADLDRVFNNFEMKKRTYNFAVFGMSLSNLFDIHQPQDLLSRLINTLQEYDQSKEEGDRPIKKLFNRSRIGKRGTGGFAAYPSSYSDGSEYLVTPNLPFPLDYHQTLLSLLDVLSEIYNKISKILGPSTFPHSSQHMMGPLGLLSPHPGVPYLFEGSQSQQSQSQEGEGSLWWIANASASHGPGGYPGAGGGSGFVHGNAAGSTSPPSWTPALGEMVLKVDGKLKKITSTLLKELDAFARNSIKDELASLDPLLRNMAVTEDAREQYDFEGM